MKPEQAFAMLVERVGAFHPVPAKFDEGELASWPAKAVASMKDGIKEKDSDKMAMKSYADKLSAEEIDALATYTLGLK